MDFPLYGQTSNRCTFKCSFCKAISTESTFECTLVSLPACLIVKIGIQQKTQPITLSTAQNSSDRPFTVKRMAISWEWKHEAETTSLRRNVFIPKQHQRQNEGISYTGNHVPTEISLQNPGINLHCGADVCV